MITAYVVLAVIVGMLVVGTIRLALSADDRRQELEHLSRRVNNLESEMAEVRSLTALEHQFEGIINRVGRLRARIRKLEDNAEGSGA